MLVKLPLPYSPNRSSLLIMVVCLVFLSTACRQSAGGVPRNSGEADDAPDITLTISPTNADGPVMGPYRWEITLLDGNGVPIDDAIVTVRGDMNHAGMVPVESTATYDGGLYVADFEWTMAGAWNVTVVATLGDGRVKSETFEYTVAVK